MLIYCLVGLTLLVCEVTAFDNATEEIPNAYLNLTEGNSLWTSLVKNCKKPTMACVEKNMYTYLQDTLDYPQDYELTTFMKFRKNQIDYDKIQHNDTTEQDSEDLEEEGEPRSSIEEMTRALHGKSLKFLMTHDMEVQLPETIFEGSTLKLSPRSFEENGALIKFEFIPKQIHGVAEGRLFKKLKKFISEKLIYALLAILLVIKLLAAKFMFFMPMMVGAVAAKKLLIKVLLFLFPALHHFFKLCAYVPHGTKFHHHKHQIAHIHHLGGHGHHHHHGHHSHGPHEEVEVIAPHADGPPSLHEGSHWFGGGHQPSLHHYVDIDPPHKPSYNPHEQEVEYFSGGPSLTHHFINHRQDASENDNEVHPWGQGQNARKPNNNRPSTPTEIENMILKAEKEALLKARLQQEKLRIQEENARLQEQLKQAMRLQDKLKQQAAVVKSRVVPQGPQALQSKLAPPPPSPFLQTSQSQTYQNTQAQQQQLINQQERIKQQQLITQHQQQEIMKQQQLQEAAKQQQLQEAAKQQRLQEEATKQQQLQIEKQKQIIKQQQQVQKTSQQTAFEQALHQAASITYDPFYSPILQKIDKILVGLGFNDEPCRERLICSMYKNPVKFSPHSNLLSAELSRDSKELQKPTTTNAAVVRFYRYVQAARDGQDKRECLRLYPACAINTEN